MNKKFAGTLPAICLWAVALQPVQGATLPAPVPRVIVSAASAWGTAADSWAGYTGALQLWLPSDTPAGWTLTFRSADLGRQAAAAGFWNAVVTYDAATQRFTVAAPSWSGAVAANSVLNIGFNGQGVLDPHVVLDDCTFNGQPCVAAVMSPGDAQQTLAGLSSGTDSGSGGTPAPGNDPPVAGGEHPGGTPGALEVLFSVNSRWAGGYGGNITVKNLSADALPAGGGWQVRLKFPDLATARDVFSSGPWNLQATMADDGTVVLGPLAWTAAVTAGGSVSSGFNGGSLANLRKAASVEESVAVVYDSSVGAGDGGGTTPPADPDPVDDGEGLPTGSLPGHFLFSPYKDAGISMNWNTNVMSTMASGSLKPLLDVLPARVPAVTWAFATGECGRENWAGIAPESLAAANVSNFVAAGKNYVVSTGGAAGAFHCGSPEGMRTFINRYASRNLVGVDFDIEAGQSAADIESLVRQVATVQADYPDLRFSFTIATLGSSNGGALTAPYGDLSVTGYHVIQALKQYPLNNYTINLMVMDYGRAGSGVCVLDNNGLCDMGETAIQAAKNLNARFGIPLSRIELTPMIGVNDVTDELFSLANTDTMVAWALGNGLAGVHFWSVDRDTPCNQSHASPICSSVPTVPAWGWTHRFATALGL